MGGVQSLVLQAWTPSGSQATDLGAYSPGSFGVCARVAGPLIGLCTHLGLQVWAPTLLIGVHTNLGFRCVLGLLIQ